MPERAPDPFRPAQVEGGRRLNLAAGVALAIVLALVVLIVVFAVR